MRLSVPIFPSMRFARCSEKRLGGVAHGVAWTTGLAVVALLLVLSGARCAAQAPPIPAAPTPQPRSFLFFRLPQRPVAQVIPLQEGPNVSARLMEQATPNNTSVIVSISKQRIYLMCENEVAIDAPVSTGRKGHPTPTGNFHIRQKDPAHMSNIYGNFVDRSGRVVRSGVSEVIDSAPSGTHFEGAPMRFFMRLTDEGVGMHIGILPGYPASHGCVRLPADIAPLIYGKVRVGTPVQVQE